MEIQLNPPVSRLSERSELVSWIEELERLRGDPEMQDPGVQERIEAHLNDARTWLHWDLHRKVMVEGREATTALREVGAFDRKSGDPPP